MRALLAGARERRSAFTKKLRQDEMRYTRVLMCIARGSHFLLKTEPISKVSLGDSGTTLATLI